MKTRRPRRSADQTRTHLIEAGIAELHKSGLSVGLDAVSLERAVRDANVPRSSAYAAWSNREDLSPQEGFQRAVLCSVVEQRKGTLEMLAEESANTLAEFSDFVPRRHQLRQLICEICSRNTTFATDSIEWKLAIALRYILFSAPEDLRETELLEWLKDSSLALREYSISTLYRPLAEVFGIVPRPQYGDTAFDLAEAAIAALSDGIIGRELIDCPELLSNVVHPDGAPGQWSLYAIMCEKVVETFFVPVNGTWDDY